MGDQRIGGAAVVRGWWRSLELVCVVWGIGGGSRGVPDGDPHPPPPPSRGQALTLSLRERGSEGEQGTDTRGPVSCCVCA